MEPLLYSAPFAWGRLGGLIGYEKTIEQLTSNKPPVAPPPQMPRQPVRFCSLLGDYACELFEAEAKYYPNSAQLGPWLITLANAIEHMVAMRITEIEKGSNASLTYHAPLGQMHVAIRDALNGKINTSLNADSPPSINALVNAPEGGKRESVSDQLARLRVEARLTVEQLAERMKLAPRSVERHLSGQTSPRLPHLAAYERIFSEVLGRKIVVTKTPGKRR